jgi:hypothetical protein
VNIRIARHPARAVALPRVPVLLLLVAACGTSTPRERTEAPREQAESAARTDSAGAGTNMVQWMFEPRADERQQLAPLLARVGGEGGGPDLRLGGTLHRFDAPGTPARYLLVAFRDTTPPPAVLGEQEVLLYQLADGGVSTPFRVTTSPQSSHPFAVARIADFDGDGAPDLAYCINAGEGDGGEPSIVGHRSGAWYTIPLPAEHGLCG